MITTLTPPGICFAPDDTSRAGESPLTSDRTKVTNQVGDVLSSTPAEQYNAERIESLLAEGKYREARQILLQFYSRLPLDESNLQQQCWAVAQWYAESYRRQSEDMFQQTKEAKKRGEGNILRTQYNLEQSLSKWDEALADHPWYKAIQKYMENNRFKEAVEALQLLFKNINFSEQAESSARKTLQLGAQLLALVRMREQIEWEQWRPIVE